MCQAITIETFIIIILLVIILLNIVILDILLLVKLHPRPIILYQLSNSLVVVKSFKLGQPSIQEERVIQRNQDSN